MENRMSSISNEGEGETGGVETQLANNPIRASGVVDGEAMFEKLRPRIEVFRKTQLDRRCFQRQYQCLFCNSDEKFPSFPAYQTHANTHVCVYCCFCYVDVSLHLPQCIKHAEYLESQMRGGGMQSTPLAIAPLLPDGMQSGQFMLKDAAHMGTMVIYEYQFHSMMESLAEALSFCRVDLRLILSQLIAHWKGVRAEISFVVIMESVDSEDRRPTTLISPFQRYVNTVSIDSRFRITLAYLQTVLQIFQESSSGYHLSQIRKVVIRIGQYLPILPRGGYIPNPPGLSNRYTTNIICDDMCFLASVVSVLKRDKVVANIYGGKSEDELTLNQRRDLPKKMKKLYYYNDVIHDIIDSGEWKTDGFTGAVGLEDLPRFTQLNNISIMVLGYEHDNFFPIFPCENRLPLHVDLILLKQANPSLSAEGTSSSFGNYNYRELESADYIYHYVASTDTCALIKRPGYGRDTLCTYCLRSTSQLAEHQQKCGILHKQNIVFPKHETWRSFQSYSKLDIVYKMFFSFNCYRELPVGGTKERANGASNFNSETNLTYSTLEANIRMHSFVIVVINCKDQLVHFEYYDGPLPAEQFFKTIIAMGEKYKLSVKEDALPLIMTTKDRIKFQQATHCELCGNRFDEERKKHTHHSHSDERVPKSILCSHCNLQLQVKSLVILGFGNSELENRLILQSLQPSIIRNVEIIAKDSTKIISLKLEKNRIVDLKLFVGCDLTTAVNKIKNVTYRGDFPKKFPSLYRGMGLENVEKGQFTQLLLDEIFFPHDWFTNPLRLEQTEFPPLEPFFKDAVFDDFISEKDYNHSKTVFKTFEAKNMKDYLALYSKVKILLIADVAINLNRLCGEKLLWYPFHFATLSSYSFFLANMYADEPYQFLKDVDATLLFRNELKGGINIVGDRYAKANNELVGNYNPKKQRKYLVFMDGNSAFCHAQLQPLPHRNFAWLTRREINNFDIMAISDRSQVGYMLLIDVDLNRELYSMTDQMPFFPQKTNVNPNDMSPLQLAMYTEIEEEISDPFTKEKLLLTMHYPKRKYWIYYKLLQFFISKGATVLHIHKILRFTCVPWMKPFATTVSDLRKQAKDDNEQFYDFILKQLYCRAFGSCCQNTAHYNDLRVSLDRQTSLKHLGRDNFKSYIIISSDVVLFQFARRTVVQSSPLASGYVILELARLNIYSFFYSLLAKISNVRLLSMDTDGFFASIPSVTSKNEIWENLSEMKELDMSRLPTNHIAYSTLNKDKPGKFSLRMWELKEVVALKPKFYSLLAHCPRCSRFSDGVCMFCLNLKRAKNIPRSVLLRLNHDYYVDCLKMPGIKYIETRSLASGNHSLGIYKTRQVGFYSFLSCRYLHNDLIHTTAYGNNAVLSTIKKDEDEKMGEDINAVFTLDNLSVFR